MDLKSVIQLSCSETKCTKLPVVAAKIMKSNNSQTSSIVLVVTAVLTVSVIMKAAPSAVSVVQDRRTLRSSGEQAATAHVNSGTIREVTTTLSSKEMEGRGMAQPGGERAANYLADKFDKAGLEPLGDESSFRQQIKIEVQTLTPDTEFKVGAHTF